MFIAWDRVERMRGTFDYSKSDYSFRLAERYGIKVVVNFGCIRNPAGVYTPRWIHDVCGATLVRPPGGRPDDGAAENVLTLCPDDPAFMREAEAFVKRTVARYRASPALAAWAPWNEIGGSLWDCRCPYTLARYRAFLKDKYGTVDRLDKAWNTECELGLKNWDEAFPAARAGFSEGGYQPFLDFREFQAWNRARIFNLVSAWIREADPDHPRVVHLADPVHADGDFEGDIIGASTYLYLRRMKERCELSDDFLNREWNYKGAVFQLCDRPWRKDPFGFWQVESEGGPIYWVHNCMPRTFAPEKMNARDMLWVSHGARSLMRWM